MKRRFAVMVAALALLVSGSSLLGRRGYLAAKAVLAEHLIESAFADTLRDGDPRPPWSWADTHPIARLEIERLGVRRHVLAGASGSSMAFGVGHIDGTAPPNGTGNCVLAGHRDTWCSFFKDLRVGDRVRVTTPGAFRSWIVEKIRVVEAAGSDVTGPTSVDRLTLVTCYPFEGLLHSPWRYVVECSPEAPVHSSRYESPGGSALTVQ